MRKDEQVSVLFWQKDYFCSLLLQSLMLKETCSSELVLKGGTCLSKIYFNLSIPNVRCEDWGVCSQAIQGQRHEPKGMYAKLNRVQ